MEKFTLVIAALVVIAAGVLDLAKFLLIQWHDFWMFLLSLRW